MDKNLRMEQGFELIFKTHYSAVKHFVLMLIKSEEDAEDIAQDVFTILWSKPHIWEDNTELDKYVYTMAKHATFDFIKHKNVERTYQDAQRDAGIIQELFASDDLLNTIYYKEAYLLLQMAIERLPERRKLIFEMSRFKNLSNQEIAERLNISVRTVEHQIYLCLAELKKIILILFFTYFV